MAAPKKQRKHVVMMTVTFNKPVTRAVAARAVRGQMSGEEFNAQDLEDMDHFDIFKVGKVTPQQLQTNTERELVTALERAVQAIRMARVSGSAELVADFCATIDRARAAV